MTACRSQPVWLSRIVQGCHSRALQLNRRLALKISQISLLASHNIFIMHCFFPKKHKNHRIVLWLMAGEFPITIVMLTLTGIASHNLYRTLLWQDGADNGFNSAPNEALYAAANYRPFTAPMVWSSLYAIPLLYTMSLLLTQTVSPTIILCSAF